MKKLDSPQRTQKAQRKAKEDSSVASETSVVKPVTDKTVKVTQLRSTIGCDRKQAAVVRGLGLRRIRHTVELPDTPATRGMIHKVRHLVEVSEGSSRKRDQELL